MNAVFDLLAEQRILEALRNGDFDHLPGAGRPLVIEDEPFVSPEQRMANHILRNAGFAPPEIGLRREIARLRAEIAGLEEGGRAVARKAQAAGGDDRAAAGEGAGVN